MLLVRIIHSQLSRQFSKAIPQQFRLPGAPLHNLHLSFTGRIPAFPRLPYLFPYAIKPCGHYPETSGISECMDRLAAQKREVRPLSTYRLQFNSDFTFVHARRLAGYLHALGVSHVYSSPILKARNGSQHGYDITDHNQLNPEVGSYEEFTELVNELRNYGMGQVLDIVPNHMGIGFGANPWWKDVLANGRASEFAEFFDLDWYPLKPELRDKLLIPILGDQYGAELEQGHIKLVVDEDGFHIAYYDKILPIDPQTIPAIFEPFSSEIHDPELRNT